MLPNDEEETIRLDLLHEVTTKRIGNKMFLAPVDGSRISRILDMGTGTGICASRSLVVRESWAGLMKTQGRWKLRIAFPMPKSVFVFRPSSMAGVRSADPRHRSSETTSVPSSRTGKRGSLLRRSASTAKPTGSRQTSNSRSTTLKAHGPAAPRSTSSLAGVSSHPSKTGPG